MLCLRHLEFWISLWVFSDSLKTNRDSFCAFTFAPQPLPPKSFFPSISTIWSYLSFCSIAREYFCLKQITKNSPQLFNFFFFFFRFHFCATVRDPLLDITVSTQRKAPSLINIAYYYPFPILFFFSLTS